MEHTLDILHSEATVRGYHDYQDSWDPGCSYRVSVNIPCMREPGNPFTVAVMRLSVTMSQKLRTIECARRPALLV